MEISTPTLLRIKPDAINKIGKYLRNGNLMKIAIFYGEGMKEILGERINISLESSEVRVQHEETVTNNDIDNIFQSALSLPGATSAVVAVGGGKVIDYCKYAGFILQIPVISVPTAVSNDGFASPVSSLLVNGKRKTMRAKIPYGVVIDTGIVKRSPAKFTLSGIGDMVSKYTAIYDWKLSYRKTGESVNDFAVLISNNSVDNLANYGHKNIEDLEFIKLLCGSLVMSGIAMEVSGSSRPASGAEHLISHAYDKISAVPSLHGLQVGVATYAVSVIQNNPKLALVKSVLEETGFIDHMRKNPLNKKEFIDAVRYARNIKEGYYTVLSEERSVDAMIDFIETDAYFGELVK
jgi:glycerol-1-phosphate dehydrogenase [NAD(P)+]